jgi:hypothetical protein
MDPTMVRIGAAVIAVVFGVLIVLRRRSHKAE